METTLPVSHIPLKSKIIITLLTLFVFSGAGLNYYESYTEQTAKLPPGLEEKQKFKVWFERWQTRFPQLEADHFKRVDDGEIISSTNPRYKFDTAPAADIVKKEIEKYKKDKTVIESSNNLQYVKFRLYFTENNGVGDPTTSYAYYYGIREDKLISGPIYECKKTKCWFDKPFFMNNDLFYLPEIQEKVYPDAPDRCSKENICAYEVLLHEFDLKKNKRQTYANTQLLTDYDQVQKALADY